MSSFEFAIISSKKAMDGKWHVSDSGGIPTDAERELGKVLSRASELGWEVVHSQITQRGGGQSEVVFEYTFLLRREHKDPTGTTPTPSRQPH